MGFINKYLNWLQKDNPTGEVERYPELDKDGQTSVSGVYVVGDLTGIPLLKMAANGGANLIRLFSRDKTFLQNKDTTDVSVVIVGGGPAGVAAAVECESKQISYVLLEGTKLFNTIENFPHAKPIIVHAGGKTESELLIQDGNKESLLEDLHKSINEDSLNIEYGRVAKIKRGNDNSLVVHTSDKAYTCTRVVLAIGKSGDARRLGVPGEDLEKVSNHLYDPRDFSNQNILVVGGGDTALETAIALAKTGNKVTISYRKAELARPKEGNKKELDQQVALGAIKLLLNSQVADITEKSVNITQDGETIVLDNSFVFVSIGRELPLSFFRRSRIRMEGEKQLSYWIFLTAMVSFFSMLYFGKSGWALDIFAGTESVTDKALAFLTAPQHTSLNVFSKNWYPSLNFILGWTGAVVFAISGVLAFGCMVKERSRYFRPGWPLIKYSYLIGSALFFVYQYFNHHYNTTASWVAGTTYWYSFFYCSTMFIFGLRRVLARRTRYITYQVTVLVFIQVFFLFLLPFHLYDSLVAVLGADSLFIKEVFPGGMWSSFAIILFWPLNMWEFGSSTFWTIFPIVQSGIILPWIIKRWGKGVYCGWICSCGGMAETLGDEYREKAPHGPTAKKWENLGQYILVYAVATTVLVFVAKIGGGGGALADGLKNTYKFFIDVFFAGVLGLGVYFFMGGRIWCRFGCPLAALMNIYTRFSRYRIVSEKKKCISCNICTKVCHMGIDVMNYANKGVPMNDAQCVRCSACVESCPMDVLAFAELPQGDPDNKLMVDVPEYGKDNWKAGIK